MYANQNWLNISSDDVPTYGCVGAHVPLDNVLPSNRESLDEKVRIDWIGQMLHWVLQCFFSMPLEIIGNTESEIPPDGVKMAENFRWVGTTIVKELSYKAKVWKPVITYRRQINKSYPDSSSFSVYLRLNSKCHPP